MTPIDIALRLALIVAGGANLALALYAATYLPEVGVLGTLAILAFVTFTALFTVPATLITILELDSDDNDD